MRWSIFPSRRGPGPGRLSIIIGSLLMILGGGLIVAAMIHIYANPVDRTVYYLRIPGIVFGLVNFCIGFFIGRRR